MHENTLLKSMLKEAIGQLEPAHDEAVQEYEAEKKHDEIKNAIEKTRKGLDCPAWFNMDNFKPEALEGALPAIEVGKNYLLTGPPNTGKTHMACALALEMVRCGGGYAMRVFEPEFAEFYQLHKGFRSSEVYARTEQMSRVPILVLDDMCRTFSMYPEIKNSLLNVFNRRAEKRLTNIVTSKYGYGEIIKQYGEDFLRRVLRKEGSKENHVVLEFKKI